MAIEKALPKDNDYNSYGLDFNNVYYKIDAMQIEPVKNEVRIHVRGYSSKEAREMQREIEEQREYWLKLSMGGEEFDKVFEESDFDDEFEFKEYINKQQEKYRQNIMGIYKKTFTTNIETLNIKDGSRNGILTAAYLYLKTLDDFKDGKDV